MTGRVIVNWYGESHFTQVDSAISRHSCFSKNHPYKIRFPHIEDFVLNLAVSVLLLFASLPDCSQKAHLGEFGVVLGMVGGPAADGSPSLLAIGSPHDGEGGVQLRSGVVWLLAATAGFAEQLCVGGRNLTVTELTGDGGSGGGVVHANIRGPR
jgi:hypothetical protein